jgi:DNA modification methylase
VLPQIGPIDLVLTDPPYGIGANKMTLGNGKSRIYRGENDWDLIPPTHSTFQKLLDMSDNQVIWGGNYFSLPISRCWFVWDKGTGENDFADCELAWTSRDAVVKKFERSWVGANAKEYDEPRSHPTQKPVELMRWCMKYFPDSHTVLDPFMGSGTTLRAA